MFVQVRIHILERHQAIHRGGCAIASAECICNGLTAWTSQAKSVHVLFKCLVRLCDPNHSAKHRRLWKIQSLFLEQGACRRVIGHHVVHCTWQLARFANMPYRQLGGSLLICLVRIYKLPLLLLLFLINSLHSRPLKSYCIIVSLYYYTI